jgi:hypothetical protein
VEQEILESLEPPEQEQLLVEQLVRQEQQVIAI